MAAKLPAELAAEHRRADAVASRVGLHPRRRRRSAKLSPTRTPRSPSARQAADSRIEVTVWRSEGSIAAICSSESDKSFTTFRMCASCASSTGEDCWDAERMIPAGSAACCAPKCE